MADQISVRAWPRSFALLGLALGLALAAFTAAPAGAATTPPVRAAFYQPWTADGWPASLQDEPFLGRYDSGSAATVAQQYSGSASFAAFVASMDSHGFALNDVLDGLRRGGEGVDFLDLMFRRR